MVNIDLEYPIMAFKEELKGDYYVFNKNDFGFVSKGQGRFYNNLHVIDSSGNTYKIVSVNVKGFAGIIKSIRFLQKIEELDLHLEKQGSTSLDELKSKILNSIKHHPRKFDSRYDGTPWSVRLSTIQSFSELFLLFR